MSGRRFSIRCLHLLPVAVAAALVGFPHGPESGSAARADGGHFVAGPPWLTYACGNTFAVANPRPEPVTVTFRVKGTPQEGAVRLPPAPAEDPHFSEVLIETRQQGTVEIFLEGERVDSAENDQLPCTTFPAAAAAAARAAAPATDGAWGAPFSWPMVAVHLSLLPDGRVLSWGKGDETDLGSPHIWDPATGGFTARPSPVWLFCAAHAFLADGRLLVAGGHIDGALGLPDIALFTPASSSWSSAAPMQLGRWYATTTTMANGEVVITAGTDQEGDNVPLPEVWTSSGGLRVLTGAGRLLPWYPRAFLAPNGRLFYAGEARTTRYLNISGAGGWSTVGNRRFANREYGSAVMYEPGKILYAGGGRTTNTAETIDLNVAAPAWKSTGSMAFPRRHLNVTVLPTGDVLATGGVGGTSHNDLSKPARAAELWSPATGTWRTLASSAVTRGYHATSILLPDGRVLHAGSGDAVSPPAPNERNAEIFSPPYLFAGSRPTITSAPGTVSYGGTFRVTTPNAGAIAKVSLIRLGSATHAFDMNQRYQALGFTKDGSGLTVTSPSSRRRTPPGHYMLFILNGSGVPSIATIMRVQ